MADAGKRYTFEDDWFSSRIPDWRKYVGHMKGQELHALEIGSHEGRSATWMIENILTHPSSTITCVDVWNQPSAERRFDANIVATEQSHRVSKIKKQSHAALRQLPLNWYSLVYIDGAHEGMNVMEDAVLSYRLLRCGGILVFDDYEWTSKNRTIMPKPAIDAFLAIYVHTTVLHKGWQVFVRKEH